VLQRWLKKARLYRIHDSLSKVTNVRAKCMPWDGTLDFWILLTITAMNLFAVVFGAFRLGDRSAIFSFTGCQSQNIQMIALVFAFIEATPGLLFIMCAPRWLRSLVSDVHGRLQACRVDASFCVSADFRVRG
jgi:hypothetical protein